MFAIDSPTRPDPIGLSLMDLLRRERNILYVDGVDVFDETPILDVKAYSPDYRTDRFRVPDWYQKLMDKAGHV